MDEHLSSLEIDQELAEKQKEIECLRDDVYSLEDELQDKGEELMSAKSSIKTFKTGKYSDDIHLCCYDLLSLNVGIRKFVPIINEESC